MTSERTILAVIGALALSVLILGAGLIYLAATNAGSEALVAVGGPLGVALGALAGLLASTRSAPPGPPA